MSVLKHDVDYCVESIQDIDALNRRVDDLRLTATAALEELDQILKKNQKVARESKWDVSTMRRNLFQIVTLLRHGI